MFHPFIYDDEMVARYRKDQKTWEKIAKTYRKISGILVVISYVFGILFLYMLVSNEQYASWVSVSLNLQITAILLAILAAFLIPALRHINSKAMEYDQLLDEYNLRLWELKLKKDISNEEREDMRMRIEQALGATQSRYKAPRAEGILLRHVVWLIFIDLTLALLLTIFGGYPEALFLVKLSWLFLIASFFKIFSQIPIVATYY